MDTKTIEMRFRVDEPAYARLLGVARATGLTRAALLRFALAAVCRDYLAVQQIALARTSRE